MSAQSEVVGQGSTRLTFRVPAARCDELIAELWALGTSGIEVTAQGDEELLEVYFEGEAPHFDREAVARRCNAVLMGADVVAARDWLADYRAACEPIAVGSLLIDPREPGQGVPSDSAGALRIPARNAFGTGSHESTRLILEALLEVELAGLSVLDVGTGSAILALAALQRGARWVVGFDVDVGSVFTAGDNAKLNRLAPALFAGSVEAVSGEFDLVVVNILPHRWLDQAPAVARCLRAGGELLVSGLLAAEAESVLASLRVLGARPTARREIGEWTCLRLTTATETAR